MNRKLFLFSIIICYTSAWAQPAQNLKKYWRYNERFKNYVVPGDCQGCSLPGTGRLYFDHDPPNTNIVDWGHLNYSDETIHLGHYIGVLATEFKLLLSHGQDTKETKKKLWYALEAFNRLDKTAEGWGDIITYMSQFQTHKMAT